MPDQTRIPILGSQKGAGRGHLNSICLQLLSSLVLLLVVFMDSFYFVSCKIVPLTNIYKNYSTLLCAKH